MGLLRARGVIGFVMSVIYVCSSAFDVRCARSAAHASARAHPGELHVGSHMVFADAGFTEVSRPSLRRVVMRIDF
jgi:hypothetical protein